jgi:hypothetical protein
MMMSLGLGGRGVVVLVRGVVRVGLVVVVRVGLVVVVLVGGVKGGGGVGVLGVLMLMGVGVVISGREEEDAELGGG